MVKILEMQHELERPSNYQSRIVEFDSFDSYLESLEKLEETTSLPKEVEVGFKTVNKEEQSVIFMYEHNLYDGHTWLEFVHFAQVIDKRDDI